MDVFWWIVISLLFVFGFLGLFVPVLPDAPLMLLGFILYHFFVAPEPLSIFFWVTAILVTVLVILIDYVAGGIAARKYGGSRASAWAAIVGGLIGLFFGPLGIFLGAVVAVILVELYQKKTMKEALRVGFGTLVGFLGGALIKGALMATMIVWFVWIVI